MGISNIANEALTQFKHNVFLVGITQHLTKIILHYKKEQESLFTLCVLEKWGSLKKWLTNSSSITCEVAKLGIEPKGSGT